MKISFEIDLGSMSLAAICGLLGLFALHAAYPGLYEFWPKSSSDLAAWVQAIFSIAAIAAGAGGIYWQVMTQARHAEEQRLEKVRMIAKAIFNCRTYLAAFLKYAPGWMDANRFADMSVWWLNVLEKIPMENYPDQRSQEVVSVILNESQPFMEIYSFSRNSIRHCTQDEILQAPEWGILLKRSEEMQNRLKWAEDVIARHLKKHGSFFPMAGFKIDDLTDSTPGGEEIFTATEKIKLGIQLIERRAAHRGQ